MVAEPGKLSKACAAHLRAGLYSQVMLISRGSLAGRARLPRARPREK